MNSERASRVFLMVSVFGSMFVLLYCLMDAGEHRNARWAAFKIAHHCRLVEAWAGEAGTEPKFPSDKTAYMCDDGVKYWR